MIDQIWLSSTRASISNYLQEGDTKMSKLDLCCKFMAEARNLKRAGDYKRSYTMRSSLF